jgi:site-specific DNA recombinase
LHRLQFLLFPEGIFYNREEDKCRTDNANGAFQYIAELKRLLDSSKSRTLLKKIESAALVAPTGIPACATQSGREPVSKV